MVLSFVNVFQKVSVGRHSKDNFIFKNLKMPFETGISFFRHVGTRAGAIK